MTVCSVVAFTGLCNLSLLFHDELTAPGTLQGLRMDSHTWAAARKDGIAFGRW